MLSLLMLVADTLVPAFSLRHSWNPNDVLTLEDIDQKNFHLFEGDPVQVDHFKVLLSESSYMLVGGRNNVFNISLLDLSEDPDRRLKWEPNKNDKKLCNEKFGEDSKDERLRSKCENFIQVLGKMNDGKLYVCGTNAFKPLCRIYQYKEANYPIQFPEYVSDHEENGQARSPYDPEHNSTSIYKDDKLYSASVADFNARDPMILRSEAKESSNNLRTAQHDSNMLNDPNFVSSFDIEDKIYFFLRENAVENINCGKAIFSRVARVCKNDHGGQVEEGVWTSFFKARLNCSFPGDIPFQFDEIQSTSKFGDGNYMPTKDSHNRTKMVYGVFNTPDNSIQGSAICAFTLDDIERAFQGKFKDQQTAIHNWLSVPMDKTPTPHPAAVCTNDSKAISDQTLTFIHKHSLMDAAVGAVGGEPVLIQTLSSGRFTAVAIDWQVLASRWYYYDVMFVGTTDGRVLKAVNVGHEGQVRSIVIEDLQVLDPDEPVRELKIFRRAEIERLIVISRENIKSISLHRCDRHKSCGDCVALQDPYCAWHGDKCTSGTSRGVQDVLNGDTSLCPDGGIREETVELYITTTELPTPATCPACSCNCSETKVDVHANASDKTSNGPLRPLPDSEDQGVDVVAQSRADPCENKFIPVRTDDQVYTASTLAIASVVSIVVAALVGFVIGYRVSLCRNNTRDAEQVISYEQHFGSLRKGSNRHSINEATHNIYSDPSVQKQLNNKANIQPNILVSNNITGKSPNLPNGQIESKTVTPKQAKTYL